MKTEAEVRAALLEAFNSVPAPPNNRGPLTHDECVEVRADLPLFVPSDMLWVLPQVLLDLIDSRTGDWMKTRNLDQVLIQLDVAKKNPVLRAAGEQSFSEITGAQASAIAMWLLLAKGWSDSEPYQSWLDNAIRYWSVRGQ